MYAEVTRVLCIQMIIQVKTQKEEADQRFGRLPPIYTVGPLTPITEVSAELSSPVTTSISDFDMDLPAESDYELVLFMIIWSHACEWMEIDHADCCNAVYWLIAFWPSYMQWKIATCNLQIVRRLQIKKTCIYADLIRLPRRKPKSTCMDCSITNLWMILMVLVQSHSNVILWLLTDIK